MLILSYLELCVTKNARERTGSLRVHCFGNACWPGSCVNVTLHRTSTSPHRILHVRPGQALYLRSWQWTGQTTLSSAHWPPDRWHMVSLATCPSWLSADRTCSSAGTRPSSFLERKYSMDEGSTSRSPGNLMFVGADDLPCEDADTAIDSMDHHFGSLILGKQL